MKAKENLTKTKLINKYKKPTLFIRIYNFCVIMKNAFHSFVEPITDMYNSYPWVHIWGNAPNSNLYTMDDISITYNVKEQMYYLSIETAYLMSGQLAWGEYLKHTLSEFTKYMDEQGYSTEEEYELFMENPGIELKAPTIEQLYTNYLLFVNAFCSTYNVDPPDEMLEGDTYV